MQCPKCQFENPDDILVCGNCASKLKLICPKCNFSNPPGFTYCGKCAHILSTPSETPPKDLFFDEKLAKIQRYLPKGLTEKILSQKDGIEGERKHVTVMFCDMEGFTSLSERIGPEETYTVMDQVYEILIHKVHDYEGTVNELTGDGIMALFGAPIALEDSAQHAIRSAIAIHKEITNFSDEIRQAKKDVPPLKMRIGIHTGPVIVGALGNDLRVEFKAVGDTVNLASRMEGLAEPGTTYVSEDIFTLTGGLFQFDPLGEIKIKGKKKPVTAYKLLSTKEEFHRPRLGLERMVYSEMVGRDKELDKLQLQVMKVINGEGSVVNVIGEAGIGKSRLVAELKGCDMIKKVTLFEGRAISIGRNLSFHLIINILKEWAQIRESDTGAAGLSKLETAVRRVDPEGIDEVFPFVATVMGLKLSGRYAERVKGIEGEALEKLILKNFRDLLIRATELSPLVIVSEDLHWADMSSTELMASLFPLVKTQRILFVNVFRPGHKETDDKIVESLKGKLSSHYIELVLQLLDERMSKTLVKNMLKIENLQHNLINIVVERAGGNPFFIEEMVRSFIDEDAVFIKGGVFETTERIDSMGIPNTINDVLMARIDRLEEDTRNLVKVASVIGRSFFYRILAEVASRVEDIYNRLSYLKEIQLIRERKRMEQVEYLFKHALTQETAYESILVQKRKEIHLKVADSIEKVFKERLHEFYGMLAYHYSNADNLDKAEKYMIKAGEEALKSSASSEALHYYQNALELYLAKSGKAVDPNTISDLEEKIGFAFFAKGYNSEAIQYFTRALANLGIKKPKNRMLIMGRLVFSLFLLLKNFYLPTIRKKKTPGSQDNRIMRILFNSGKALSAVDMKRMVIDNIIITMPIAFRFDISKSQTFFDALSGLSALFSYTGISHGISKRILRYARKAAKKKDSAVSLYFYKFMESVHDYTEGNWFREFDESAIDYAVKIGDLFTASVHLSYLFRMRWITGDSDICERIIEKFRNIVESFDHDHANLMFYTNFTYYLLGKGKLIQALKSSNDAIELSEQIGVEPQKLNMVAYKLRIQVMLDELEAAKKTIAIGDTLLRDVNHFPPISIGSFFSAKFFYDIAILENLNVLRKQQDVSKLERAAFISGKKALSNSKKNAAIRTEVYRLRGIYYWIVNKEKKALQWWSTAISEGTRLGARPDLARTYMEVGKHLSEPESKYKELNGIKAKEYLNKARSMLNEMNLQWDIDELERLS